MSGWQSVLLEPAKVIVAQIGQFFINVLLVVIILVIGMIISKLIKTVVTKMLRAIKLDELSDSIELDSLLEKGGIKYSLSELLGTVIYWLAILVTFVVAVNAIGLTVTAELLNRVVLYVPNIIAAMFILILGIFIATFLKNLVQTMATNTGLSESKLLGKIVQVLVMIFTVAIAMEQLNIGYKTIQLVLSIILGAAGLAAALAFGLGCREIAAKFVAELIEKMKK
jgi:hypothetical protein